MIKLLKVYESPVLGKKLRAEFDIDGRIKHTDFGATGYDDYTIHKDTERRERYRIRHKKDLKTMDPIRPGFLSYYLLWGPSSNLAANIRRYKQLFNL